MLSVFFKMYLFSPSFVLAIYSDVSIQKLFVRLFSYFIFNYLKLYIVLKNQHLLKIQPTSIHQPTKSSRTERAQQSFQELDVFLSKIIIDTIFNITFGIQLIGYKANNQNKIKKIYLNISRNNDDDGRIKRKRIIFNFY